MELLKRLFNNLKLLVLIFVYITLIVFVFNVALEWISAKDTSLNILGFFSVGLIVTVTTTIFLSLFNFGWDTTQTKKMKKI
jgi:hypothetical protein